MIERELGRAQVELVCLVVEVVELIELAIGCVAGWFAL
jgi:hypothetical protein